MGRVQTKIRCRRKPLTTEELNETVEAMQALGSAGAAKKLGITRRRVYYRYKRWLQTNNHTHLLDLKQQRKEVFLQVRTGVADEVIK